MNLSVYKALLTRFLAASETEVLDVFGSLKGAVRTRDYVFIPGQRDDRILLVAHADTAGFNGDPVWHGDTATTLLWGTSGYHYTDVKGKDHHNLVLGADDRAGCALMYNIFNGEHSLLITTGEEKGCIGAKAAVREIKDLLQNHQFALQVDRRGDRQAVFYSVGTQPFQKYIMAQLEQFDYNKQPWSNEPGSFTDIAEMCPDLGICGVNLSAGYVNEHGAQEILLLGAWLHTRTVVRRLIHQTHLPKFALARRSTQVHPFRGHTVKSGEFTTLWDWEQKRWVPTGMTQTGSPPSRLTKVTLAGTTNEPMITFQNKLIAIRELTKNQRKAILKGLRKSVHNNSIDVRDAIELAMLLIPPGDNARDILELPPRPITESEREGHWTGDSWERRSQVVKLQTCQHGVQEGRYCDRVPCIGIVGLSVATIASSPRCKVHDVRKRKDTCRHGNSRFIHCTDCEVAEDGMAEAVYAAVEHVTCLHNVPVYLHCMKCHEPTADELVLEVIEAHAEPMPLLLPAPKRGSLSAETSSSESSDNRLDRKRQDGVSRGFDLGGDGIQH